MLDSVRSRLTIWHVAVLAFVLLVFSAGIYGLLANNLRTRTDASVDAALKAMEHLLASLPAASNVNEPGTPGLRPALPPAILDNPASM